MLISSISNLSDLLLTRSISQASTKLSDDKRDAQTLSILCSHANPVFVPFFAYFSVSELRLSIGALMWVASAAVSMVIQDVPTRAEIGTWRRLEANWEIETFHKTDLIWEWGRLEPHGLTWVVLLILFVDLLIERSQILLIEVTRREEHWILCGIGRKRLIQRIIA